MNEMITEQIYEQKRAKWASQATRVFETLHEETLTRLQVSSKTGIPIQNICRFIATLRKENRVCIVKKAVDPLSKMPAEFLSTNEKVCQPCQTGQTNLFQ